MAVLEERSYSNVLAVWLPQMLEDSYKQIASDLLPRQNMKSRAFFSQTVTVIKARSKILNSNPSSNRKKGVKRYP
jgi:hypothetical protein